jgi:hypothetical protein
VHQKCTNSAPKVHQQCIKSAPNYIAYCKLLEQHKALVYHWWLFTCVEIYLC